MNPKFSDIEIAKETYKEMFRKQLFPNHTRASATIEENETFERLYNEKLAEKKRLEEEAKPES